MPNIFAEFKTLAYENTNFQTLLSTFQEEDCPRVPEEVDALGL